MASAQVSWNETGGVVRQESARLEDTSHSGACIRVRVPIHVGSELQVKWHKEQFSGITRYCRKDGMEYVLGIQRSTSLSIVQSAVRHDPDTIVLPEPKNPSSAKVQSTMLQRATSPPAPVAAGSAQAPVPATASVPPSETPSAPARTSAPEQVAAAAPTPETIQESVVSALVQLVAQRQTSLAPGHVEAPRIQKTKPHARRLKRKLRVPQANVEVQATPTSVPGIRERNAMLEKWINRGSGRQPQETAPEKTNGKHTPKESMNMYNETPSVKHPVVNTNSNGKGNAAFQGELLSLEDIYRAAGIMNLRLGYSINTVIEMLNSDHIRGLPSEVKRAAVLMALETAGMPIAEVLEDAAQRHEAINAYEAAQQKHVEEYENRKVEENDQIQVEIERLTAQLTERMKQNLDEVIAVKDTFRRWQSMKEKESQRIADAASLCEKNPPASAPSPERIESVVAMQAAGFVTKP